MIPLRKEHTLSQHGAIISSNQMSISATPEMFDLLSSGIYKNPIKAVVREYLANACDESKTVDVTVPSPLTPYFEVRDYGKGMSEEFVLELLSSYGFSNKTTNNNQIGGFGIGSKSGFAYTDSFTITSWFEGTKSVYECTKNVDGTFSISLRGRVNSTESSGVKVCIPVKNRDYTEFKREIEYYATFLAYFSKVNFKGVATNTITFEQVRGDLYRFTEQKQYNTWRTPAATLLVVMGGIPYSCSHQELVDNKLSSLLDSSNLVIVRPIGSLNITASRESIRYTEQTTADLKPILTSAVEDVIKKYREELEAKTTPYEKFRYLYSIPYNVRIYMKVNVDLEYSKFKEVKVNRSGSVSELKYYHYNRLFASNDSTNVKYLLIDTDKFVPSRIKKVWETESDLLYISPVGTLKEAEDELATLGVPYLKLSDYEPLKKAKAKSTKASGPSIKDTQALVVYYKGKNYRDVEYSTETTVDLDNLTNTCYYIRDTEKEYEDYITTHKINRGYYVISATNKNLTKLKASKVPHISEVLKLWIADGGADKVGYFKSYLNTVHSNDTPKEMNYIENLNYHNNGFAGAHDWTTLPTFIKDNMSKPKAEAYYKELLKKIDYIKSLTVKDYTGTKDVSIHEYTNWSYFKSEVGL